MIFDNEITNTLEISLSYNELIKIFHNLYNELKNIDKKYSSLKRLMLTY